MKKCRQFALTPAAKKRVWKMMKNCYTIKGKVQSNELNEAEQICKIIKSFELWNYYNAIAVIIYASFMRNAFSAKAPSFSRAKVGSHDKTAECMLVQQSISQSKRCRTGVVNQMWCNFLIADCFLSRGWNLLLRHTHLLLKRWVRDWFKALNIENADLELRSAGKVGCSWTNCSAITW